ncbi:hypothetical protein ABZ345_25955 [Lentzea sp. NPDC005914]|uniref:hypothetical protein n=1 Tax=Lentzea sp. NPDC005914 TaxID=3154572 RepID=UPI00340A2D58
MAGAVGIVFGLCVLSFTLGAALMYVVLRRREDARAPSTSADEPVERTWVEKPAVVEPVDDEYDSRPIHRNPVVGLPPLEPALAAFAEPVAEAERPAGLERIADAGRGAESAAEPEPVAESARVAEAQPVAAAAPETVGAARYDWDGDLEPPLGVVEAPESTVAAGTDSSEFVDTDSSEVVEEPVAEAEPEPKREPVPKAEAEPMPEPEPELEGEPELEAGPKPELGPEPKSEVDPEPGPEVVAETTLPPPAEPQPAERTTWVEREDFRQRYLRTFEEVRRKAGSN